MTPNRLRTEGRCGVPKTASIVGVFSLSELLGQNHLFTAAELQ